MKYFVHSIEVSQRDPLRIQESQITKDKILGGDLQEKKYLLVATLTK